MALPVGLTSTNDVDLIAKTIKSDLLSMARSLQTWGSSLNAGGQLWSNDVETNVQAMASVRAKIEAAKILPGLGTAYARQFDGYNKDNIQSDWGATKAALDPLIDALTTNYQEKTASGKLAFRQIKAGTQELESFTINITAGQRSALVNMINAIIATLS